MSNQEKTLKKKELSFCYHYIETGNAFEAAKLAGYKNNVRAKAIKLLETFAIPLNFCFPKIFLTKI